MQERRRSEGGSCCPCRRVYSALPAGWYQSFFFRGFSESTSPLWILCAKTIAAFRARCDSHRLASRQSVTVELKCEELGNEVGKVPSYLHVES